MINKIFTVAIIFLSITNFSLAWAEDSKSFKPTEQETKEVFEGAQIFSECAGQFDALSWFAEKAGLQESSVSFKNSYRGWQLSGAYLLFSTGIVNDWKKAQEHTEAISSAISQKYKARMETDLEATQKKLNEDFDLKCKPYIDYQESLVADMRRKMAQMPAEAK